MQPQQTQPTQFTQASTDSVIPPTYEQNAEGDLPEVLSDDDFVSGTPRRQIPYTQAGETDALDDAAYYQHPKRQKLAE